MRVQLRDGDVMDFTKAGAVPEKRAYTTAMQRTHTSDSHPTFTLPSGLSANQEHFVTGLTATPIKEEEEPAQHCVSVFQSEPIEHIDLRFDCERAPKIDSHVVHVVKQRLEALEVFGSYITEEQSGYIRALKWVLEVAK